MTSVERIRKNIENFVELYGGVIVLSKNLSDKNLIRSFNIENVSSYALYEFNYEQQVAGHPYPVVGVGGSLSKLKRDDEIKVLSHNHKIYTR